MIGQFLREFSDENLIAHGIANVTSFWNSFKRSCCVVCCDNQYQQLWFSYVQALQPTYSKQQVEQNIQAHVNLEPQRGLKEKFSNRYVPIFTFFSLKKVTNTKICKINTSITHNLRVQYTSYTFYEITHNKTSNSLYMAIPTLLWRGPCITYNNKFYLQFAVQEMHP